EWGGADPNNRGMWRGGGALSAEEQATLDRTRALGTARRELVALRRGVYVPIQATEDALVFGRKSDDGQFAIVALTRAAAGQTITAPLPVTMNVKDGTKLRDRLGGNDVMVTGGA